MTNIDLQLVSIPSVDLETVSGGMFFVDGKCIVGCQASNPTPASQGITADQLWQDQLKRKRR